MFLQKLTILLYLQHQTLQELQIRKLTSKTFNSTLEDHNLSLVFFGDEIEHESYLKKLRLNEIQVKLETSPKNFEKFFVDEEFNNDLLNSESVRESPDFYLYWHGIQLHPIRMNPVNHENLYGKIKDLYSRTKDQKYLEVSAEEYFEFNKKEHTYQIVCACQEDSYERNFMEIYSKHPQPKVGQIYMSSDPDMLEALSPLELQENKKNHIMVINNIVKEIVVYKGDLSYVAFDNWLTTELMENYGSMFGDMERLWEVLRVQKKAMLVITPSFNRLVADKIPLILFKFFSEQNQFSVVCTKPSEKIDKYLGYLEGPKPNHDGVAYQFWYYNDLKYRQRYRIDIEKFEESKETSQMIDLMNSINSGKEKPYIFSESSTKNLDAISIRKKHMTNLTANNYENIVKESKMDVLVMSYENCGANCKELMEIFMKFLLEVCNESVLQNLVVASCNVRLNEVDWEFRRPGLVVQYSRKTGGGKWIDVGEVRGVKDLKSFVGKYASFDFRDMVKADMNKDEYYDGYL